MWQNTKNTVSDKDPWQRLFSRVILLLGILLLGACEEKLTAYNWDKLAEFQVNQNTFAFIPNLSDAVKVHVANIRSGTRAHIEIITKAGEPLASRRSVRQGDGVRFKFKEHTYLVKVERYEARLIRDYAILSISVGRPKELVSEPNVRK
mgnify:CR=1 FL=1